MDYSKYTFKQLPEKISEIEILKVSFYLKRSRRPVLNLPLELCGDGSVESI